MSTPKFAADHTTGFFTKGLVVLSQAEYTIKGKEIPVNTKGGEMPKCGIILHQVAVMSDPNLHIKEPEMFARFEDVQVRTAFAVNSLLYLKVGKTTALPLNGDNMSAKVRFKKRDMVQPLATMISLQPPYQAAKKGKKPDKIAA